MVPHTVRTGANPVARSVSLGLAGPVIQRLGWLIVDQLARVRLPSGPPLSPRTILSANGQAGWPSTSQYGFDPRQDRSRSRGCSVQQQHPTVPWSEYGCKSRHSLRQARASPSRSRARRSWSRGPMAHDCRLSPGQCGFDSRRDRSGLIASGADPLEGWRPRRRRQPPPLQ